MLLAYPHLCAPRVDMTCQPSAAPFSWPGCHQPSAVTSAGLLLTGQQASLAEPPPQVFLWPCSHCGPHCPPEPPVASLVPPSWPLPPS